MDEPIIYEWERLPEYVATQQYSRCLGRIFRSLPRRVRRRVTEPMTRAAVLMGAGIVGFNAETPPRETLSAAEREMFRSGALEAIETSREGLASLRDVRRVSRPDLLVAGELLDRIEGSVRAAEVRPDWL